MNEGIEIKENKIASLLLVDDEKNILTSLKRLFRSEGYSIHLANSGAEGLKILEDEEIDLVISDMRMPEMNGAEFLEKVSNVWPKITRILLTGYSEISSTIDAINKGNIYKYISKPWEENDLKLTVRNALESRRIELERDRLLDLTRKQNEELKEFNSNLEDMVKSRTSELDQAMGMLETAYDSLKDNYSKTIDVFSSLIEIREGRLKGHSRRVARQAQNLASKIGMDDDEAKQVSFAAMLRDIGKIGFKDNLLNKPFESLDIINKAEFCKHPIIASGILMMLAPLKEVSSLIRHSHERYDGTGYPDHYAGDKIPTGSRVLAIVSDFDALQTGHLINKKLTRSEAIEFIIENKGSRYDPVISDEFIKLLKSNNSKKSVDNAVEMIYTASDIKPGMILSRDLVSNKGILLLSEGSKLGENIISQLKKLESSLNEILQIHIKP